MKLIRKHALLGAGDFLARLALCFACMSAPANAVFAQAGADAARYGESGNEHYANGRYEEAYEAYETASRLAPAEPRWGFNAALALEQLGRYEEAVSRHLQARVGATTSEVERSSADVVDLCQRRLSQTHGLAVINFAGDAKGAEVRASTGGTAAPLPPIRQTLCLRAGSHRVTGFFVHSPSKAFEVVVRPAALGAVPTATTVAPAPTIVEPRVDLATPGWITLGVGAAAMIAGGIVAGVGDGELQDANALEYSGDASDETARNVFLNYRSSAQTDALNKRTAGWVTFGVGAGAAVAGAILLILDESHDASGKDPHRTTWNIAPMWDERATGASMGWTF